MAAASSSMQIQPIDPPTGPTIGLLAGDATLSPASSGASGGWQVVDRPKQPAFIQWFDSPPLQIAFSFIIDGHRGPNNVVSVEAGCLNIETLLYPPPGRLQPPVVKLSGPIPPLAAYKSWVLYNYKEGAAIRTGDGYRTQQEFALTFYEFTPPVQSDLIHLSPSESARIALSSSATLSAKQTYIVRSGDTLQRIAAQVLGNYKLAPNIAALNGIRDPSAIRVGQTLVLP